MPVYTYKCKKDGCEFFDDYYFTSTEARNEITMNCPKCGSEMSRMFGIPTLNFVGGGWAKDNYNKPKVEPKVETKSNE